MMWGLSLQKFNISNPTTGAQKVLEVEDERKLCAPSKRAFVCVARYTQIAFPCPLRLS